MAAFPYWWRSLVVVGSSGGGLAVVVLVVAGLVVVVLLVAGSCGGPGGGTGGAPAQRGLRCGGTGGGRAWWWSCRAAVVVRVAVVAAWRWQEVVGWWWCGRVEGLHYLLVSCMLYALRSLWEVGRGGVCGLGQGPCGAHDHWLRAVPSGGAGLDGRAAEGRRQVDARRPVRGNRRLLHAACLPFLSGSYIKVVAS